MGLGGYLAARTDAEHYAAERAREKRETIEIPEEEIREVLRQVAVYAGFPSAWNALATMKAALREPAGASR